MEFQDELSEAGVASPGPLAFQDEDEDGGGDVTDVVVFLNDQEEHEVACPEGVGGRDAQGAQDAQDMEHEHEVAFLAEDKPHEVADQEAYQGNQTFHGKDNQDEDEDVDEEEEMKGVDELEKGVDQDSQREVFLVHVHL